MDSILRWSHVGARLSMIEISFMYIIPPILLIFSTYSGLMLNHCFWQLLLFIPVCQIPAYLTGKMTYVDIAWPGGVTLLSIYAYNTATGYTPRVTLWVFVYFMIGFRMFAGALYSFYPYRFKEDLGRYRYAKSKWLQEYPTDGEQTWWIKVQQDTLTQCFANMFTLSVPLFIVCQNQYRYLYISEVLCIIGWFVCFI